MESSEVNPAEDTTPRKRRFTLQWSLTTMLLLTAVVAAWVPYVRFRLQIPQAEQRIAAMQEMARELIIKDPKKITVVKLQETWYMENRWDIHLPEGDYRMLLATQEVDGFGFPSAARQSPLSAGEHRIELLQSKEEDGWKITILVDDRPLIEVVESPGWNPGHGSSGASPIGNCTQISPDRPIILFRRRFMQPTGNGSSTTPNGPTEGLMLWIERIGEERSLCPSAIRSEPLQ